MKHWLRLAPLAAIAVLLALAGGAFAYTAGWLSPGRLTPARMIQALSERGGDPVGHRRNHSKGICFSGHFDANGAGAALSSAPMLAAGRYPVVGRFSIGVGNPAAADAATPVRSMAIRIVAPDGQEWRSAMNNSPVFVVADAEAFYELAAAMRARPGGGLADPQALAAFFAGHPETAAFRAWAAEAPWTASWADQRYNGLNAFEMVDAAGRRQAVRWSMLPSQTPSPETRERLAARGPDFLEEDLRERLARGPLTWTLAVTLAAPGDPTDDATEAWPDERPQVAVGTLTVVADEAEAAGACRDYNFDPTILPAGIEPSDDPLLAARSSSYARSFDLRTAETAGRGRAASEAGR